MEDKQIITPAPKPKMDGVERRRRFIINVVFFVIVLGAFYLFMKYAFWLFAPFLFAIAVATALQKPVKFVAEKTPLKRGLLSALFVLGALAIVGTLLGAVGARIVTEFRGLIENMMAWVGNFMEDPSVVESMEQNVLNSLNFLPESLEKAVGSALSGFVEDLMQRLQGTVPKDAASGASGFDFGLLLSPLGSIWDTAKQIPSMIISFVVAIVASIFMTAEYPMLIGFVRRQIPMEKRPMLSSSKRILLSALGKLGKSYAIIIFITFCEMAVSLNILKFAGLYNGGYIVAIAFATALVDILPILGTGTILLPWLAFSFLTGNISLGIGLLVTYGVITVLRQFIEPKLVAANLGLPSILTIAGMYTGLQLFGFIGLFFVPISLIFIKLLNDEGIVRLWKRSADEKRERAQKEEETGEEVSLK